MAERQHSIWLDTELADWNTRTPRLSLIQLRLEDGSVHIIDVLAPGMIAAYQETFAPRVLAAPQIEKWAHYARFERRVFGPDVVQGLHCTFELARGLPYYRLPLRSLRLGNLVLHLFGEAIDKSYQKADWGHRPLSAEELDYAAWDPEWCYRIRQRLQPLAQSWDPATDDPDAIQRRYVEILPGLRDAKQWRTAIWEVVKAFMAAGERERFSDFLLQMRVIRTVPIPALAAAVAEVDPMRVAEFAVSVPAALLELLRPGGEAALREAGQETVTARFRGPRAPRERKARLRARSGGARPCRDRVRRGRSRASEAGIGTSGAEGPHARLDGLHEGEQMGRLRDQRQLTSAPRGCPHRVRVAAGWRDLFDGPAGKIPASLLASADRRAERVRGRRPDPGHALAAPSYRRADRDRPFPRLARRRRWGLAPAGRSLRDVGVLGDRGRLRNGQVVLPQPGTCIAIADVPALTREMIGSSLPRSGMPMAVQAGAFQGSGGRAHVMLGLQLAGASFKFIEQDGTARDTLEVSVAAMDAAGKITATNQRVALNLKPETRKSV